ncbi:MAG: FecR family protein [Candidatus Omnitrophica bacterium]|nr:FecR family protein [Candidatus Omnitrophota bacterium]MCF7894397.1 FecR family protein [Candidatus Omnitrophota bacterium]
MKKIFGFLFVFSFLFTGLVWAQTAKIIKLEGSVQMKKTETDSWQVATMGTYLKKQAEIKTKADSSCTLAFDKQLDNLITIEQNSHLKLTRLKPAELFLPEGRVFSIVDNLADLGEFKVKTPVVVAGVRGTGDSVESSEDGTIVKCFQGEIYVKSLLKSGNPIVGRGLGVNVGPSGQIGDIFNLSGDDWRIWNRFISGINNLRGSLHQRPSRNSGIDRLKNEGRNSIQEEFFQKRRQDEKRNSSSESSTSDDVYDTIERRQQ